MLQSSAPDPKLWARLEKWLIDDSARSFQFWMEDGIYVAVSDEAAHYGRTFNAALRKFLKGVGA